jgi:glycerophosphoryl diester phosphodiesterase
LINQSKYSDIQKLPLSITKPKFNTDQKNYLCTLDDYLDVCQKFDKAPIIEIKSNDLTNADCVVLSNKIHKRGLFEKTAFISFEFDSLKTLRTAMPKITIYDLIDTKLAKNGLGKSGVKVSINLNHNVSVRSCLATKKIVKLAHEHHLLISI